MIYKIEDIAEISVNGINLTVKTKLVKNISSKNKFAGSSRVSRTEVTLIIY